jgi:hypothetical protein
MEKRQGKRSKSYIKCELISRSLNFPGWIENFSEDGLCVLKDSTKAVEDIPAGMLFMVEFPSHSGDTIAVQCRVIHTYKTSPDGPTNKVGMEIIDKSEEYKKFLTTQE